MLIIGKNIGLHGQKSAAGISDIDAVEAATFGNGLGPDMFFQCDGKIGSGLDPAVIGNDHGPVVVDFSKACYNAAAGNICNSRIIDGKSRKKGEFKKNSARINQIADQLPYRAFALFGQPGHCFFTTGPHGLVDALIQ